MGRGLFTRFNANKHLEKIELLPCDMVHWEFLLQLFRLFRTKRLDGLQVWAK